MKNIIIRRPKLCNQLEINKLFEVTIQDAFKKEGVGDAIDEINEQICHKKLLIDDDLKSNCKSRLFLIAEHQGHIVGTISHGWRSELIAECADRDVSDMQEIASIYILPEFQGQGIARVLLNAMLLCLLSKGINEFCLDTGYTIARQVWSKLLGTPSVIKKDYWDEGVDHCVWFKSVTDISVTFNI